MSHAAEVVADRSGKWTGNGLRFATPGEAQLYASDLASRWTLVEKTRVVESSDPVNYTFVNGQLARVEVEEVPVAVPRS